MTKAIVNISRYFVGILFIFSGLVKLNDPLGFAYKLEEYFSPGVLDIPFLMPYALLLSVLLVIIEVLLGIALIIGYAKKITIWSLLLMIVFFTFLTFYSAYFNKVTDCGCFGDAIPLTPWQSFGKDVILSVFILILFFNQKKISPILPQSSLKWIVFVSSVFCLFIAYHVLMHLPLIDFRAYSIGTNIFKARTTPEDAPPAIIDYHWQFEIDGEMKTITTRGNFPQVKGEFLEVTTEVIREAYTPPIHDFSLVRNNTDFTEDLLQEPKLLIIVAYNLNKTESEGWSRINNLIDNAKKEGYRVIGLTASGKDSIDQLLATYNLELMFYNCDETAIKTIVRANPGIISLQNGTIIQKLHWNNANDFKFN